MSVNQDHITGFLVGVGVSAAAFYMYKKNQQQVDEWLRQQGINVPSSVVLDPSAMTLEELVKEKESLEDTIAEREMATSEKKTSRTRKKTS